MQHAFTLAHLSDIHLSPVRGFTPRHWNAKRALGYVNWTTKRRHVHLRGVADRIVADIHLQRPDHIAVTGDLVNIGLPHEYAAAAAWLASVGKPANVSLVPGNHDIYTVVRADPGIGRWSDYMRSDAWGAELDADAAAGFPYLHRAGPLAIIGLCSAVETPPAIATGRLGSRQLDRLAALLQRLEGLDVFRLVLIHHPPLPGRTRPRHELLDAAETQDVLAGSCADLVLHGHTHLPTLVEIERASRKPLPVLGVASASAATPHGSEPAAQYNLIGVDRDDAGWKIHISRRGMVGGDGRIEEIARLAPG